MTTVQAMIGNYEIEIKDFHSDPVDDFYLYPKVMPSSVRKKLIEYANERSIPELMAIIDILNERFPK